MPRPLCRLYPCARQEVAALEAGDPLLGSLARAGKKKDLLEPRVGVCACTISKAFELTSAGASELVRG